MLALLVYTISLRITVNICFLHVTLSIFLHAVVSPLRHLTHYVTSIPATGARTGIHTHNDVIALLETYIREQLR